MLVEGHGHAVLHSAAYILMLFMQCDHDTGRKRFLHVLVIISHENAMQHDVWLTFWLDGSLLISLDFMSSNQLGIEGRTPLPS